MKTKQLILTIALLALTSAQVIAAPLGTAFTYQGRLADGRYPANGSYDLTFTLYATTGGPELPVGGPLTNSATAVTNGLFTITLDFGADVFAGSARWLGIGVRTNGADVDFTPLTPRQALTPTPYSIYAASAGTAATAGSAGSVAATNITGALGTAQIPDLDAAKITSGTLADPQLSANVALRSGGNTFSGDQTINSGSVVINPPASTQGLTVNVDGKAVGFRAVTDGFSSWQEFDDSSGAVRGIIGVDGYAFSGNPNQFSIATWTATPIKFFTDQQERMAITPDGLVGIGTKSPAAKLEVAGTVKATAFLGDGSGLTTLNAASVTGTLGTGQIPNLDAGKTTTGTFAPTQIPNLDAAKITSGTLALAQLPGTVVTNGASGVTLAGTLSGDGSGLTALSAANVTGTLGADQIPNLDAGKITTGTLGTAQIPDLDAAKITSGTVADARLSANVALLNSSQTFSGAKTFSANVTATGSLRLGGLLRAGSETGAAPPFYPANPDGSTGLVIRRITSSTSVSNSVVARTDQLTLVRDGTASGLNIVFAGAGITTINATGITRAGNVVTRVLSTASPPLWTVVFSDSQKVVHYDISFGDIYDTSHTCHVVLDRYDDGAVSDYFMVGTLTSTYNQ